MKEFYYSLRLGIDPNHWTKKKEEALLKFINEARINDINVILNSEELNHGHMPLDEIDKWLLVSTEIGEAVKKTGCELSLNPWTTLLHSDRGRVLKDEFKFRTMVDYKGVEATAVACPADPMWQEMISSTYAHYAKIKPKYLWLDDDFRHFNHKPLKFGCFCDYHMKLYANQLGYSTNRIQFVEKLLEPGVVNKEREVYLNQACDEMITTAKLMRDKVEEVSIETQLGLMSSNPEWHQSEGRDWRALFEALSTNDNYISRPHLPAYNEATGSQYLRDFNRSTRVVADMIGPKGILMPELENYMYSTYAKSNTFTQLQLESCAHIAAKGILMNLYDMMGNGVVDEYNHHKFLDESKEFLNYMMSDPLDISNIQGVKVLYAQDTLYKRVLDSSSLESFIPHEFEWLALLGSFGISCKPQNIYESLNMEGEVLAASDQVLRNLSNEEITKLFINNQMMIDGTSVEILFERGLQHLIFAKSYTKHAPHTGYQSYEEAVGEKLICGVEHARITMMQQCGDYYNIIYEDHIEPITRVYDEYAKLLGNGLISQENALILPIGYHSTYGWQAQYINYRESMIKEFVNKNKKQIYLVNMPVVQLSSDSHKLLITNFSLDTYDQIRIVNPNWKSQAINITIRNRESELNTEALKHEDHYVISYKLKAYETLCIKETS